MLQAWLSDLKLLLSLVFLSILLAVFDYFGFLSIPKSLIQQITIPIQYGLYKTSGSVFRQFEFIVMARRASQENVALKEQLGQVISENSRIRKKLDETESLLAQQTSISPQTFNLVTARPIGISRYLNIDKGLDDGLKLGQAVIFKDNYIGKIKNISQKKSQVILSSDPDSRISAFVSSANGKAKGVLTGQFGAEMLFDKILHSEPLNKNDLVYTEGTEEQIPRGLILGQVTKVSSNDNEVFKKAQVKNIFEVSDLDLVFVVTN